MLVNLFDTHAYVKKLVAVGFTEQQAEVQAVTLKDIIEDQIATKKDLKELEAELKKAIKELEGNTKRDIKELELKIDSKVDSTKADLIKWVTGLLAAQIIAGIIIAKLLFH